MIISGKKCLIDTNIFIYAQDKKSAHFEEASKILRYLNEEKFQAFITLQNLLEYSAVLTRFYKYPKKDVVSDLKILVSNPKIVKLYPSDKTTVEFLKLMEKEPKIYIYDLYLGENEKYSTVSKWFDIPVSEIKTAVQFEHSLWV